MVYTTPKLLTFETFIDRYGDNTRYELADGELVEMEPTGLHETVRIKNLVSQYMNESDRYSRQRNPFSAFSLLSKLTVSVQPAWRAITPIK